MERFPTLFIGYTKDTDDGSDAEQSSLYSKFDYSPRTAPYAKENQ